MLTLNTILKELKNVPVSRLEDLYSIIRSFTAPQHQSENKKEQILFYAGCFGDMSTEEFSDFDREVKNIRSQLFERDMDL